MIYISAITAYAKSAWKNSARMESLNVKRGLHRNDGSPMAGCAKVIDKQHRLLLMANHILNGID